MGLLSCRCATNDGRPRTAAMQLMCYSTWKVCCGTGAAAARWAEREPCVAACSSAVALGLGLTSRTASVTRLAAAQ